MKLTLFLLTTMGLCLVSALADRTGRKLVNPLKFDTYPYVLRQRRSPNEGDKGGVPVQPHLVVTKGEYICGNKVCKLEPGVVPKNCNGMCQYPIIPKFNNK